MASAAAAASRIRGVGLTTCLAAAASTAPDISRIGDNGLFSWSLNHIRLVLANFSKALDPIILGGSSGLRSLFLNLTITGAVTGLVAAAVTGGAAVTATDVRFRRPGAAVDGLGGGG